MVSKKKQLIPLRYRIIAVLILLGLAAGALGIRQAVFYAVEKRQRQAFDNVTSTTINRIKERVAIELGLSGFLADADSRAAELVAGLYSGFGSDVAVRFITTETVE